MSRLIISTQIRRSFTCSDEHPNPYPILHAPATWQEELADEIKNREAAIARLDLMSQAIPKLHQDLKRVQDQLVQSRMEVRSTDDDVLLEAPPSSRPLLAFPCSPASEFPNGNSLPWGW